MKIVVLDGYTLSQEDLSWAEIEKLGRTTVYERTPAHAVVGRCKGAQIVLANKTPIRENDFDALPDLEFVGVTATGYDIVDITAAEKRGIPVSNVPEYGTDSVGQFVFALLMELCHHVAAHDEAVKAGEWAVSPDWCFWKSPQWLLRDRKMGIVGFGRIGRRVGELAHAFGMEVLAHDPHGQIMGSPSYEPFQWASLEALFAEADVVTLHCPQTKDNVRFVNQGLIGSMKKRAFFINTARGGLVEEQDLADALNDGRIAGAALDVLSKEPVEPENPLLSANNCLVTPHIAWSTKAARQALMTATVENIKAFQSGHPIHVVNQACPASR